MALQSLYESVVEDGVVDAGEVEEIRKEVYADGKVDIEEVEFLFKINDAVSGNKNDTGWDDLFVSAITDNIMDDGVIDSDEVDLLVRLIGADGKVDGAEKKLLENLKGKNEGNLPSELESLLS